MDRTNSNAQEAHDRQVLARKLEELLKARGIKKADLADRLGVYGSRVQKWLSCEGDPRPGHLVGMSEFFGVALEYLCDSRIESSAWQRYLSAGRTAATADQLFLDGIVQRIGHDEAIRRLLATPEPSTPPAAAVPAPETTTAPPAAARATGRSQIDPTKLEETERARPGPGAAGGKPEGSAKKPLNHDRSIGKGKG